MNFGPSFLRAVSALYARPMAQVCVNNFRSDDFWLGRGTRQGCPLSLILFAISLEPLAAAIRGNPKIKGVDIDSTVFKLNLFADDTVVYLRDPLVSLPLLISEFEAFGKISGFTINQSKSEVYPVAISSCLRKQITDQFSFRWVSASWRHLGIHIPLDLKNVYSVNYTPLRAKICSTLHRW